MSYPINEIKSDQWYSLSEILDLALIPGKNTYTKVYGLVTFAEVVDTKTSPHTLSGFTRFGKKAIVRKPRPTAPTKEKRDKYILPYRMLKTRGSDYTVYQIKGADIIAYRKSQKMF